MDKKIDEAESIDQLMKGLVISRFSLKNESTSKRAIRIEEDKKILKTILSNRANGKGVSATCRELNIRVQRYYSILKKAGITISKQIAQDSPIAGGSTSPINEPDIELSLEDNSENETDLSNQGKEYCDPRKINWNMYQKHKIQKK